MYIFDRSFGTISRFKGHPKDAKPEDAIAEDSIETTRDRYTQIIVKRFDTGQEVFVFEHEDSGILTSDPFKFEKWLIRL